MAGRLNRTGCILPAEGFRGLQNAKQQIQDAAVGKLPEHLVLAAVEAAMRCTQEGRALSEVLAPNVAALVRETLKGLRREAEWKPDTILARLRLKPTDAWVAWGIDKSSDPAHKTGWLPCA